MKRDPEALAEKPADLLVVGGGIYGAAIAREAALRGLDVALVERLDFGSATSANSHRIIHGGLRYLQHLDVRRMRESLRERFTLERIAPHLVHPLPVVVPTLGHGLRGKEILSLGIQLRRLLGLGTGSSPAGEIEGLAEGPISRREVLELLPGIEDSGLTGGVIFYDSQVRNSERLLFGYLRSAADAGARLANYVEATGFLRERGRVGGIVARDALSGARFEIHARTVVNAAGPWIAELLHLHDLPWSDRPLASAVNAVTRQLFPRVAAGLYGRRLHHDRDAIVSRGQRLYFLVPWRDRTIVGTVYATHPRSPSQFRVRRTQVEELLDEINAACPAAKLTLGDVSLVYSGLLPSAGVSPRTGEVQVSTRYRIHDHAADAAPGLFSVEGVKYTTARDVAEKFVDSLFRSWRKTGPASRSAELPLPGGDVGPFADYLRSELAKAPAGLSPETLERLVRSYGSEYRRVLRHLHVPAEAGTPDAAAVRAEALHAVREEMALTLADVVLRRTELGSAGHPGRATLETIAAELARELGWSPERTSREIADVEARYGIPPEP